MDKIYLDHRLSLISYKLEGTDNHLVQLNFEGNADECMKLIEELEKAAKKYLRELGK